MSFAARRFVVSMLVLALSMMGCDAPTRSRPVATPVAAVAPPPQEAATAEPAPIAPDPSEQVPVTANEPASGEPLAPVTWVIWGDYECPFTAKLFLRLDAYMTEYGPKKLRVVWRNNPLPFHKQARPLAIAAETVFQLGGARAFWKFSYSVFSHQRELTAENLEKWVVGAGVDLGQFWKAFDLGTYSSKIDEDISLGKQVGVTGTPASFINGVFLSGARADEDFVTAIDGELVKAAALAAKGVPPEQLYARLVEAAYVKPADRSSHPKAKEDTTTVWRVAVGSSPVRGKATAPVTLVVFSDFQCPFCAKTKPTLEALATEYGDKLRVVFKHNPLPFHPRAEPAAQFAAEARAQGGDAKFWAAHDLLYANQEHLSDEDFKDFAAKLGLNAAKVASAVAKHKHAAVLDTDQLAALDLQATGTPHFFINGRRLVGAQPVEKFKAIIDEEVARADKLAAAGTPAAKLYEALQKDARDPPVPERILAPAPTAKNPSKGAAGAKVVVQMFSDFQCPFCKRADPTMDELIAAFPGQVRVVFRHRPLPMHKQAQLAAEAAMEAFAQKGNTGFWAFAKLLWADQSATALGKDELIEKAKSAGLDAARMKTALENGTHRAEVDADAKLADQLKITGTPAFAVNDYYVSGAQSLVAFRRAVKLALGPRVPPTPESLLGAIKAPDAPAPAPSATGTMFGAKHLVVMYQGSNRAPATVTRTKAEARALAEKARKQALAGARFEDLVTMYSDEPGAAARGGDLGKFPTGRMVAEFQTGVESTRVGEISEIVETPFGFHVILRTQ